MAEYWSKEAYRERIKWWNEDIARLRDSIRKHGGEVTRCLLRSLLASKKWHQLTFKIHNRGK